MSRDCKRIPYVNLSRQHRSLKRELLEAVGKVIDHGQFILGDEVEEFEQRFGDLCGTPYAVAVNSGTDALVLALRALDIGPGAEVITAPNSFVASASCIALVGATPVFADVGDDYNLDVKCVERSITPRTRAVIPVHLTGRPADMDAILAVAQAHDLYIIEDCAQAIFAEYRGQHVGGFGHIGCFSLHPLKTLNACGDGGVVVTREKILAERMRILRNLGLCNRDNCEIWSSSSRLDTLQAAILLVKLKYLEEWTNQRRANASFYQQELANVSQIRMPVDRPHERAVYHTFVIQAERRDDLKKFLATNGIETAIHYPIPIHLQKAASGLGYKMGDFPVTEDQAKCILSLPIFPELTQDDLKYVVGCIREFYT